MILNRASRELHLTDTVLQLIVFTLLVSLP